MTRVTFFTGSSVVWGAEMSLLTIAEHSGNDVHLVTSHLPLAEEWTKRVNEHALTVRAPSGRVARILGFVRTALRSAWRGDSIIVFDFYLLPLFALLRPIIRMRGGHLIVDVHDAVDQNPRRAPYFWLMRFCDGAICISQYIAGQVHGVRKFLVYRPVEAPVMADIGSYGGVVGIVGQISPDKATDLAIRAAADVPSVAKVVVRGTASAHYTEYLEMILQLGHDLLGNRFVYEGRVDRSSTMTGLDVLATTNPAEPFGRVVAEGQLAGVIVVGPSSGGIAEIISDGVTGYVYNPRDRAALADAIERGIHAPAGMRDNARSAARAAFDPSAQAQQYLRKILEL